MICGGAKIRPRTLIIGFDEEPELVNRLRQLAPTARVVDNPRDVDQTEFDRPVTDRYQSRGLSQDFQIVDFGWPTTSR